MGDLYVKMTRNDWSAASKPRESYWSVTSNVFVKILYPDIQLSVIGIFIVSIKKKFVLIWLVRNQSFVLEMKC